MLKVNFFLCNFLHFKVSFEKSEPLNSACRQNKMPCVRLHRACRQVTDLAAPSF